MRAACPFLLVFLPALLHGQLGTMTVLTSDVIAKMKMLVTGSPFSVDQVTEQVRILPDGSRISKHYLQFRIYRDSKGRVRREIFAPRAGANSDKPLSISLQDPATYFGATLKPETRTAWMQPMPGTTYSMPIRQIASAAGAIGRMGAGPRGVITSVPSGNNNGVTLNIDIRRESLGTQTIDGVSAEGTRIRRSLRSGGLHNRTARCSPGSALAVPRPF